MLSNTRYIAALWVVAIVFGFPMLVAIGLAISRGDLQLVVPIIAFCAVMLVLRRRTQNKFAKLLLTAQSPEPLLAFYRRVLRSKMIPDQDALLAQSCAIVYILYGDAERADAELAHVDWTNRPPLILGLRESALALKSFLVTHDYPEGLAFAQRALNLCQVNTNFPGAKVSAAAVSSYVDIGRILTARPSRRLLETLESRLDLLPHLGRLIVWWGLAMGCGKAGDSRAEHWQNLLRLHAPHCKALWLHERALDVSAS